MSATTKTTHTRTFYRMDWLVNADLLDHEPTEDDWMAVGSEECDDDSQRSEDQQSRVRIQRKYDAYRKFYPSRVVRVVQVKETWTVTPVEVG